jgi:dTDP-L-rhamnose 4-epimerase
VRALVTGGGGFIGSHLVERSVADRYDVVVMDRAPRYVSAGIELIEADLNELGVAERAVAEVEVVFHLAAKVGLAVDFSDAPAYVADNDLATVRLLASLAETGFEGRLILSSSMVIYGEGRYRCPTHDRVVPRSRRAVDLDAGRFEPTCPTVMRRCRGGWSTRRPRSTPDRCTRLPRRFRSACALYGPGTPAGR